MLIINLQIYTKMLLAELEKNVQSEHKSSPCTVYVKYNEQKFINLLLFRKQITTVESYVNLKYD